MPKVNGVGIIAIAAGGLLAYSALFGKSFSSEVRTLLAGGNPASAQSANLIDSSTTSTNASNTQGFTGFSQNIQHAPGVGESAWINSLLLSIGAPTTKANVKSLQAWIAHEGAWGTQGGNGNNPLNTSLTSSPGYIGKWSAAPVVSMFDTLNNGLIATVTTLHGGNYGDIVSQLRSGNGLCGQSFSGLSTWSGGGYSQVCLNGSINRHSANRHSYLCGKRLVSNSPIPLGYRCGGIASLRVYVWSRETKRTIGSRSIIHISDYCTSHANQGQKLAC
jgi:hypothetical protein